MNRIRSSNQRKKGVMYIRKLALSQEAMELLRTENNRLKDKNKENFIALDKNIKEAAEVVENLRGDIQKEAAEAVEFIEAAEAVENLRGDKEAAEAVENLRGDIQKEMQVAKSQKGEEILVPESIFEGDCVTFERVYEDWQICIQKLLIRQKANTKDLITDWFKYVDVIMRETELGETEQDEDIFGRPEDIRQGLKDMGNLSMVIGIAFAVLALIINSSKDIGNC